MAQKAAKSANRKAMEILHGWQLHREMTDDDMANGLGVSRSTYLRWRNDSTAIPHDQFVRALNLLKLPHEDAVQALTMGLRI